MAKTLSPEPADVATPFIATASPNLADQALLAADPTFILRVQQALLLYAGTVLTEVDTIAYHYSRVRFANAFIQNMSAGVSPTPAAKAFSFGIATDSAVIGDATQGGTVPLTSQNAQAQAALVTDPHITAALTNIYNYYINKLN